MKPRPTPKARRDWRRPPFPPVPAILKFLRAYGRGPEAQAARHEFATRLGTSEMYLQQLAYGIRRASMEFALRLEQATHGLIRAEDMCPSPVWAYLAGREPRAAAAATRSRARFRTQGVHL